MDILFVAGGTAFILMYTWILCFAIKLHRKSV
jgi:hypothetical protein